MKKLKSVISFFTDNIEYLFLVIAFPAIVSFVVLVPPGWGPDEQVHIARAYDISQGNMYPGSTGVKGHYGAELPTSLVNILNHGHSESNTSKINEPFYKRKDIVNQKKNKNLEDQLIGGGSLTQYDFGATGTNSPAAYLPSAVGFYIARQANLSVDSSVELARLSLSAVYLAICFGSLFILRQSKVKWLVFMVVLLPSTIFQASIVTADTLTIAAATLFFSLIYVFYSKGYKFDKRLTYLLIATSALLAFTKAGYVLLLGALLFIPEKKYWPGKKERYIKFGTILFVALLFVWVTLLGIGYADTVVVYKDPATVANISLVGQTNWIAQHPTLFIKVIARSLIEYSRYWHQSLVGLLGYNSIPTPYLLTQILTVNIFIAALYSRTKNSLKPGMIMLAAGAASSLAVVYLLYASFNTIGAPLILGIQGRYFIPVLLFVFYGAAQIMPIKVEMSDRFADVFFVTSSAAALYATLAAYMMALY